MVLTPLAVIVALWFGPAFAKAMAGDALNKSRFRLFLAIKPIADICVLYDAVDDGGLVVDGFVEFVAEDDDGHVLFYETVE